MQLLATIKDEDLGFGVDGTPPEDYRLLKASRAALINDKNQVALVYVTSEQCHKLPGGGAKKGETEEDTLIREIREEVGADINEIQELGEIVEYRNKFKLKQISSFYLVKQKGSLHDPQHDPNEIKNGLKIEWHTIDEAIEILEKDEPILYGAIFMKKRDLIFLKKAQEIINKK